MKMLNYEQLLDKGRAEFPEAVRTFERFEPPKARGHLQGSKTIITNFPQIVSALNRDSDQFLKFILKELATPGELRKGFLLLGRKVSASSFNEKIKKYVDTYVICSECGKPDTQLIKEKNVPYMKCLACGAKHVVKGRV
jgi:translation initiation factor 2 subunit 2